MNLEARKLELMQLLLETQEEGVLIQLKEVFERETLIQKEMVESAKRANEDIEAGRVYTPEEVDGLLERRFSS